MCLQRLLKIERRRVTSSHHGDKITGSQQSFLTEMAVRIVDRWKKSMATLFFPECNHAQESHTSQYFRFLAMFAGARFVEIQQ